MKCLYLLNQTLTEDIAPSIAQRREQGATGEGECRTQKTHAELHPASILLCHPSHAINLVLIHSSPDSASLKVSPYVRTVCESFYKATQNNRNLAKFPK